MYESIYKNNELENEVSLDMSYFWYSDVFYAAKWQTRVCLQGMCCIIISMTINHQCCLVAFDI